MNRKSSINQNAPKMAEKESQIAQNGGNRTETTMTKQKM
jgi:hypothetical protein